MYRRLPPTVLTAAVALTLAACGGGSPAAEPAATSTATRTVAEAVGEVEVPERPQRVALIYQTSALAIALRHGVAVVGAGHSPLLEGSFPSWLDDEQTADIADTGWNEVDIEAIAALRPDLIISTPAIEENDRLRQIAPVAQVDQDSDALSQSVDAWRQMLHSAGEVLGVRAGVQDDLADLAERIADLRDRLPDGLSVSAVRVSANAGASVYPAGRLHAALLAVRGRRPPRSARRTCCSMSSRPGC